MPNPVIDQPERHRFELVEEGLIAFADYRIDGDALVILHVEAPPGLRGKGTAGRLMQGVVAHAAARDRRIVPICGYARVWLERNAP